MKATDDNSQAVLVATTTPGGLSLDIYGEGAAREFVEMLAAIAEERLSHAENSPQPAGG